MEISNHSKKEIIRELQTINMNNITPYKAYLMIQIEQLVEKIVINKIKERQKKVPNLKQDEGGYLAYWGGELTPGCRDCCLKGRWTQIRTTTKCTRNCRFCYYYNQTQLKIPKNTYLLRPNYLLEDDVKLLFKAKAVKFINGIAWLHYEPLMEMEKIPPIMKYVHDNKIHQWLYTNGDLATEDNLKILADSGLDEIRFNLAASNCSDKVINHMKIARKLFKYLCVESPMYSDFYYNFKAKRDRILDTGVDHIHFAELQLFPSSVNAFKKEGPYYRYHSGYVSPISSRQLVYDIFDLAVDERWKNVVLHDCSNQVKFYRGVYSGRNAFNEISYMNQNGVQPLEDPSYMGINWFIDAVMRYREIGNDFK